MKHQHINPELFAWNRSRFARAMHEDSIAVFCSNDMVASNGGIHSRFRQNPDLFYLCGIHQPDTVVVLAPNTSKEGFEEVLFIRRPDHPELIRSGSGLSPQQAAQISGIAQVCFLDELEGILHELVLLSRRIYVNAREDRFAYSEAQNADLRFAERLMKLYPAHKYHRAQPILKSIGMVKSAPEVALINQGAEIAQDAILEALSTLVPGNTEYHIESELMRGVLQTGAFGIAHPIKVATGKNSLYPNYSDNANELREGELTQLSLGVYHAGYNASVARVFPNSGHFSAPQAKLYNHVTSLLEDGGRHLVPGTILPEIERQFAGACADICTSLGIEHPKKGIHFQNQMFHHVGRNLRDPYDPYTPLQSGMVLCCEPAIFDPKSGIGIQLRDVILVTDEGAVNLTTKVPTATGEIEALAMAMA